MLMTAMFLAALAQSPTANVDTTRAAYTKCLRTHLKKSLEAKVEEAEFEMSLKSTCSTESDAFHAAVLASNRAAGDNAADAKENADMQVEDYHASFKEKFADYKSTNTLPGND